MHQDPFFATQKPHGIPYLESLHRTYQSPGVPKRGEASFKKAMQFRQQEKAHYKQLEEQVEEWRARCDAYSRVNAEMKAEADKVRVLLEQLSKSSENERSKLSGAVDSSVGSRQPESDRSSGRMAKSAEVGDDGERRSRDPRDDEARVDGGGERERVPGEVLPGKRGSVGGPGAEHATEGSERRGGSVDGRDVGSEDAPEADEE